MHYVSIKNIWNLPLSKTIAVNIINSIDFNTKKIISGITVFLKQNVKK